MAKKPKRKRMRKPAKRKRQNYDKLPTYQMLATLGVFFLYAEPICGSDITKSIGVPPGMVSNILHRLVDKRMVMRCLGKEPDGLIEVGRPRVLYLLTPKGRAYSKRYNVAVIATNPRLVPFDEFKI